MKHKTRWISAVLLVVGALLVGPGCASTGTNTSVHVGVGVGFGHPYGYGPGWGYRPGYRPGYPIGPRPPRPTPYREEAPATVDLDEILPPAGDLIQAE